MLEAALLKDIVLYDVELKKAELGKIPTLLEELRCRSEGRYSNFIIETLARMLSLEPKNRLNFTAVIDSI